MLLFLNLPLVGVFASILKIPTTPLYIGVIVFAVLGVYGLSFNRFDLIVLFILGIVGYFLRKNDFPLAPFVMALVLAPLFEENFRRAMNSANGNLLTFIERPISLSILILIVLVVVFPPVYKYLKNRNNVHMDKKRGGNVHG